MTLPVTMTLTALCGLLLVALAMRISMLRMRHKIAFGDGGNAALMRAVRVHANTAEHAPIFILLALAYELTRGATTFLTVVVAVFVLARIGFSIAIIGRGLHQLRMVTAMLTYLTQAVLAGALLVAALALP